MRIRNILLSLEDIRWEIGGHIDRFLMGYGGKYDVVSEYDFVIGLIKLTLNDLQDQHFYQYSVVDEFHTTISHLTDIGDGITLERMAKSRYILHCMDGITELIQMCSDLRMEEIAFGDWRVFQLTSHLICVQYCGDLRIKEWYEMKGISDYVTDTNLIYCNRVRDYLNSKLLTYGDGDIQHIINMFVTEILQYVPEYGPHLALSQKITFVIESVLGYDCSELVGVVSEMLVENHLDEIETLRGRNSLQRKLQYANGIISLT